MLRRLVGGLLIACCVIAVAHSQRPPEDSKPAVSDPSTKPAASDQRGTDESSLAIKILPTEQTEKQAEAEKAEKSAIDKRLADETQRIADYTLYLARLTIGVVFIAVLQAGLFFRQLILMRRSMVDATIAANAAKANAEAVVENQRPFVGPITTSTNGIPLAVGTGYHGFCVVISNTGNTPAQRMKVIFRGEIRPAEWVPRFPPAPTTEPPKTLFPQVPDLHYPFVNEPGLTQAQLDRINAGTDRMWIIGRIEYFDNRNKHRYTNICTVWDRSRTVFVPHREHNDAS